MKTFKIPRFKNKKQKNMVIGLVSGAVAATILAFGIYGGIQYHNHAVKQNKTYVPQAVRQMDKILFTNNEVLSEITHNMTDKTTQKGFNVAKEVNEGILVSSQTSADYVDEDSISKLDKTYFIKDERQQYFGAYQTLRSIQTLSIQILANISTKSNADTVKTLKANQSNFEKNLPRFKRYQIQLLKAAGYSDKEAQKISDKAIDDGDQVVLTPEQQEKLNTYLK